MVDSTVCALQTRMGVDCSAYDSCRKQAMASFMQANESVARRQNGGYPSVFLYINIYIYVYNVYIYMQNSQAKKSSKSFCSSKPTPFFMGDFQ